MGALSKYGTHNGQPETLEDYRIRRRNERRNGVRTVKTELRVRDGVGCRWPGCEFWKQGYAVHGAHLDDMGMGGDKQLLRSQRHTMIRFCVKHHGPGPWSIHSKDLRVVCLTEKGTDGPCQFEERDPKSPNGWRVVGAEDDFTFHARRNEAADEQDDDE